MPTPGEHKTVQARILAYAEAIGWTIVSREEAERRRGFEPQMAQMGTDEESEENHLRKSAVQFSSVRAVISLTTS